MNWLEELGFNKQQTGSYFGKPDSYSQPVPTPTPSPTPGLNMAPIATPNPATDFEGLLLVAAERARQRGFHPSAIASQMASESQRGQSRFARERNNYFGIGAFDNNLDNTWKFPKPEDSIDALLNLYQNDERYKDAYSVRHDPVQFIQGVKSAGYASDPDYVWKIMNTPEWRQFQ